MNHRDNSIAAVVVLFWPSDDILQVLTTCLSSISRVFVVVNAAKDDLINLLKTNPKFSIILNDHNVGLATAFNQGIEAAFSHTEISYVLLLDQDSEFSSTLPTALRLEYQRAVKHGLNPACVGPMLNDVKSINSKMKYREKNLDGFILVDVIASSGCLISRNAYEKTGTLLDCLFIDGIDYEWCFRAKSIGLNTIVTTNVLMNHNMGVKELSYFGTFKPIHISPIRHYYIVRNAIFLCSLAYIPIGWRATELLKTFRRIVFYIYISESRKKTISLIVRALYDGITKQMGALKP